MLEDGNSTVQQEADERGKMLKGVSKRSRKGVGRMPVRTVNVGGA